MQYEREIGKYWKYVDEILTGIPNNIIKIGGPTTMDMYGGARRTLDNGQYVIARKETVGISRKHA